MRQRSRARTVFFLILSCATLVRFIGLFKHATIPDEAFTFFIASHPVHTIVTLLRTGDFHPPLIYLIGHFLLRLTSQAYLFRIVTALFGVAGVAATYALARRIIGSWAELAALLVAINPALAFFDGFFRMYAPLWSLAMISWACLLWALDEPRRWSRWLAYGAALTALLYTQYLAFFTLAGQIAFVAVLHRRAHGFWWSVAGALCAFAPWLPIFFAQYPLGGTAFNQFQGHLGALYVILPLLLVDGLPPALEYSPITIALLVVCLAGGVIIAARTQRWAALALFLPIVLQVAYSLVSGKLLLGQRYLLQAIPPIVLLCVVLLAWLWTTRLRLLALAAASALGILTLVGTLDKHFLSSFMPVDWTTYGKFLDEKIKPGDAIVFDSGMVYYVLVGSKAATNRPMFLITNPREAARDGAAAARFPRVWYVGYQSELPDPDNVAFRALLQSHPQRTSWRTTAAGYGDVVFTTLFARRGATRGP